MFSTIFCELPAFSRVDPVSTSGPTSRAITIFASRATGIRPFAVITTLAALRFCVYFRPSITYAPDAPPPPRTRRNPPPRLHRHLAVLAIHQPHDFPCRHAVEILRCRIPLFREPMFCEPIFFREMLRAPAFLTLGCHPRIIQASENLPWHSPSRLCASDNFNELSAATMNHHTSCGLRRIATRRQANHINGNQLC